jgi:hypothetical protein
MCGTFTGKYRKKMKKNIDEETNLRKVVKYLNETLQKTIVKLFKIY